MSKNITGYACHALGEETLISQIGEADVVVRIVGPNLIIDDTDAQRPILFFGPDSRRLAEIFKEWNDDDSDGDYSIDQFVVLATETLLADGYRWGLFHPRDLASYGWQ